MNRRAEKGAVSLFVVIFAMLIITVVTVSFIRLTISDQEDATNANLAEGAENSALAGVEDVKRALTRYTNYCETSSESECEQLEEQITSDVCNRVVRIEDVIAEDDVSGGTTSSPGEIIIQQRQDEDNSDSVLEQAYTCVTMELDTDDYLGTINTSSSAIIPLVATEDIDRVTIEWFSKDDLSTSSGDYSVSLSDGTKKYVYSDWPANRPSIMAAQIMQFSNDGFKLSDFDTTTSLDGTTQSNTNTVFMYPASSGISSSTFAGLDLRRTSATTDEGDTSKANMVGVKCQSSLSGGGYACKMTLTLPEPVDADGDGESDRTAYLRLTSYYNSTHYRVTMQKGSATNTVQFHAVQPEVDSTGRANNVFKRVVSRIDMYGTSSLSAIFPNAAVEVTGNFCKDFSVTDSKYYSGSCEP